MKEELIFLKRGSKKTEIIANPNMCKIIIAFVFWGLSLLIL